MMKVNANRFPQVSYKVMSIHSVAYNISPQRANVTLFSKTTLNGLQSQFLCFLHNNRTNSEQNYFMVLHTRCVLKVK